MSDLMRSRSEVTVKLRLGLVRGRRGSLSICPQRVCDNRERNRRQCGYGGHRNDQRLSFRFIAANLTSVTPRRNRRHDERVIGWSVATSSPVSLAMRSTSNSSRLRDESAAPYPITRPSARGRARSSGSPSVIESSASNLAGCTRARPAPTTTARSGRSGERDGCHHDLPSPGPPPS